MYRHTQIILRQLAVVPFRWSLITGIVYFVFWVQYYLVNNNQITYIMILPSQEIFKAAWFLPTLGWDDGQD